MQYRLDPKALKAARLAAGLKPEHAALAVDRGKELIVSYELGRALPPMPILLELCDLYGCDPSDLFVPVDGDAESDAVRRLRVESRRAQGLPEHVEDPVALAQGAQLLRPQA